MKYLALLASFVIAFIGLLFETLQRDSSGAKIQGRFGLYKLTRAGLVLLGLLALSTGLGMWLQLRSDIRARDDGDQLRTEIRRLQSPFSHELKLSAVIDITGATVPDYISRIRRAEGNKALFRIKSALQPTCQNSIENKACALFGGPTLRLFFLPGQRLPPLASQQDILRLARQSGLGILVLSLKNDDVAPSEMGTYLLGCETGTTHCGFVTYDSRTDSLELEVKNEEIVFQNDSGTFRSLLDFPGSAVVVTLDNPYETPMEIRSLKLTTPTGRSLEIGPLQQLPLTCPGGCPESYYATTLGKNVTWN
jgi:hypothetical protein